MLKFGMVDLNRNIFAKAELLLGEFPVLVILGARQVGKTTLSKQLRPNWRYFDLENPNDRTLIQDDPVFFFEQYPQDIIIDEAQLDPSVFQVLRGVVDANRKQMGRFIVTGSSSPELLAQTSETLAGRVAIIELGTLKANEIFAKPLSDFYTIFQEKLSKDSLEILNQIQPLERKQVQEAWFFGGYPDAVRKSNDVWQRWMYNYQQTYINRDLAALFQN